MTLTEIRSWFITSTGRTDLVNDDGSDNGADDYINAGSKLLDEMVGGIKENSRIIKAISADAYHLDFPDCRSVKSVWVADANGRHKLDRKDLSDIRELYADPESDIDTGRPLYWDYALIGLAPNQADEELTDFTSLYDYFTIMFGNHFNYTGIYFMPPADGTYTMNIYGKFFQKELSSDTDVNYWTVVYPKYLVDASTYCLEITYRNMAGATAEYVNLKRLAKGVDDTMVEREMSGITEMEG